MSIETPLLKRIQAVRLFLKIPMAIISKNLGMTAFNYRLFEQGEIKADSISLEDIAKAMDTTPEFIESFIMGLGAEEEMPNDKKEKPFGPHSFFSGPERELEITIRIKIK